MNEDHEPGRCGACHEELPVRWKNIYTTGSEGTWLCLPCELKVVRLIEKLSGEAMLRKRDEYVRLRKERDNARTNGVDCDHA
jgi:hypothetical protein